MDNASCNKPAISFVYHTWPKRKINRKKNKNKIIKPCSRLSTVRGYIAAALCIQKDIKKTPVTLTFDA